MTDIRDDEPSLEGQIGYRGPAFIAHLFGYSGTGTEPAENVDGGPE
jgi:hypothetical protein